LVANEADDRFRDYAVARLPALQRTALLLTSRREDAQDILQTALTRLFVAWPRVERTDNPDAYVRRALVNASIDLRRSAWRRRERIADALPEVAVGADAFTQIDDQLCLLRALQELTVRQRTVLVLRFYEDLSEAVTAELLNVSVGTVKSQTSRALAKLRRRLVDYPRKDSHAAP